MNIDPGVVTLIQNTFLEQIGDAMSVTARYASNLLYLFATLELVIIGLVWALQRDIIWSKLVFKVINIGFIYFVIQNYQWLLSTILESFAQLAGVVVNNTTVAEYIFSPTKLWLYGYDVGVHLLQLAASTNIIGLTMIHLMLGAGILLVFGLLGVQLILQIVGFYLVSFSALIMLPFGAMSTTRSWFDSAVQAVLRAGLRLMTLIIVIGIAVITWEGFDLNELSSSADFNITQPLGLFFTALLFLCLARQLPKMVSEVIGNLSREILGGDHAGAEGTTVNVSSPAWQESSVVVNTPASATGGLSDIQAATTISASGNEGISSPASATTISTGIGSSSLSAASTQSSSDAMRATTLSKSISDITVKRIKEAVVKAFQEKKQENNP